MVPFVAFVAGLIFSFGLAISGMTRPDKVVRFLDLSGDWDPSLALVMVGAIGVHFVLSRLILRRAGPLGAPRFLLPTRRDIDGRLLVGAALFGLGWALGGICPGPGIVDLATGDWMPLTFGAAMLAGMALVDGADRWRQARDTGLGHLPEESG